jgi:hypothetical protein
MERIGRSLIVAGLLIAGAGLLLVLGERLPFRIGRLPGDIVWKGKNTTFYFPLMTSLLLSAVLTLVMWLLNRR